MSLSENNSEKIPQAKRPRGRPLGSKNKYGKDARELIARGGHGAVETLLRVAAGQALYSAPGDDGKRQKIVPTLDQRLVAARTILDRLVPSLKSAEVNSTSDVTLTGEVSTTNLAGALLSVLHNAATLRNDESSTEQGIGQSTHFSMRHSRHAS